MPFRLPALAFAAAFAASQAAAQTVPVPQPGQAAGGEDPGFQTVVVQPPAGVEPERFGAAVAEALPREMTDPQQNFMRDPAARNLAPFRLVMVFHGSANAPEADICGSASAAAQVVPRPPDPNGDPAAPTSVTAAFCREQQELSRAHARITGGLDPGQAGFRFLVADVTKQLFPLGFAVLPGRGTAGSAVGAPPAGR